ncbi:MAG: Mrp/NBP35 family ATP-binding protein [Deltaproteobacteria bacterium]|nr:Mrp/NBP35 family ATP-binding protein [Deltaproteobacteria bacterium]
MSNAPNDHIQQPQVLAALSTVLEPDLGGDLVRLGLVRDVRVDGTRVALTLVHTSPASPVADTLVEAIRQALAPLGVTDITFATTLEVPKVPAAPAAERPAGPGPGPHGPPPARMPGVRAVIAVASGKGGVGKSTVATNLAIALHKLGAKVGLLDADIYGPSVPIMLGLRGVRPAVTADERIAPLQRYGLSVMSMGFMLAEDQAVVWRGPMLGKALQQFIEDVDWGDKDYVVIDMPPGTGDVQLSLAQLLPVAGAVVVTTPQDVAFADVLRAIKMFEMTKTDVIGVVENMSGFVCGNCGTPHAIFGESRVDHHANERDLDVLGKIPLDAVTAIAADQGEPITVAAPDSAAAATYREIARQVARRVAILAHHKARQAEKTKGFFGAPPKPV